MGNTGPDVLADIQMVGCCTLRPERESCLLNILYETGVYHGTVVEFDTGQALQVLVAALEMERRQPEKGPLL